MAAEKRSYGAGSLYVHTDAAGRDMYYGRWRRDGQQLNRCLGLKRQGKLGLTLPQAEAELRRLIAEAKPTRQAGGEALTIAELGRRYVADLERQGRKKATVVAVESILRVWLEPFLGDRDVHRVTAEDVHDLIRLMEQGDRPGARQKGDRRYGRAVGVKSIRNYIGTLSALLGFAERKGWLEVNVARRIDLPQAARSEDIHFLEVDEVNALVAAAQPGAYEAIDRALYLTAAMTGLRQGELVALRWRDVDWPAGRVRVRQNYVLGEFGTPKSKRSTRSVPMADAVGGELERLFKASSRQGDGDLVFADPFTAGPLNKAAILRRYRKALKATKLNEAHRFHDLRHTFGTRMAAAGVSMRTLQEWMGHRDIETTQRYADYAPSPHEAAFVEAAFSAEEIPVGTSSEQPERSQAHPSAAEGS
jgi:integrase